MFIEQSLQNPRLYLSPQRNPVYWGFFFSIFNFNILNIYFFLKTKNMEAFL